MVPKGERRLNNMKKKISTLLAILSMMALITSCGSPIASDKALSVANQVVQVTEDYLDGNKDGDNAYEQIGKLYHDLDYVDDYTYDDKKDDAQKAADYNIQLNVLCLHTSMLIDNTSGTPDTFKKLQADLDKLKESIKEYD